jgi:hypothetical protein
VSTPIALFSDWVIQHILSAPTSKFSRSNRGDKKKLSVAPEAVNSSTKPNTNPEGIANQSHRKTGFLSKATPDRLEANVSIVPGEPDKQVSVAVGSGVTGAKRRVAHWTLLLDKVRIAQQSYRKSAEQDFSALVHELKVYRQTLADHPHDLAEFDSKLLLRIFLSFFIFSHDVFLFSALGFGSSNRRF